MCVGPEVLAAAQIFGAVTGGISALSALSGKKSSAQEPAVVTSNPVADDTAAKTQAAQEAQAATLAARQKARSNSLLSQAGAAGDLSAPETASGGAQAKLSLGA